MGLGISKHYSYSFHSISPKPKPGDNYPNNGETPTFTFLVDLPNIETRMALSNFNKGMNGKSSDVQ